MECVTCDTCDQLQMQPRENKHQNVLPFFFLSVVAVHLKNSPKFKYVQAELSEAGEARKMYHLMASVTTKMKIFKPK